ncbi:MAG: hypothetical protein ACUVV3_01440 [Dehalococcoidia bacterium]
MAGLIAGLAAACAGEEEEAATATPTATATPAVAATPTRTAAPTPTATRVPSPTATATPTVVAAPSQPGNFSDYPAAIASYLTEMGGSASCLAELFAAWDMPTGVPEWAEESGAVDCAAGDLDGDGEDEYLVRLTNPVVTGVWADAEVLIFDRGAAGYEVAFQASTTLGPSPPWQPVILGIRDFNGDGKLEASFTADSCGAHTCWTYVYILAWDGQQYVDIIDGEVTVPYARGIRFVDVESDGIEELHVAAGQIGSVGAGPQRDANFTYAWDGINYVLIETEYEPSDELYFAVVDGDEAYAAGDLEKAVQLYDKAINEASLADWKEAFSGVSGRDELIPYARFRLYLAQLASLPTDSGPSAQDLVDSIAALLGEFPESLHAYAAWHFAQAYPDGEVSPQALSLGCAAFLATVEEYREEFDAAWDYGYANPPLVPESLCPY